MLGTLVTIALATATQAFAANSQAQPPLGEIIVREAANKSSSPFNLKSFIVVLDEAPLISLEDRLASRNVDESVPAQTAKLGARAAQAQLIETQQTAFASSLRRDLPDAKIDLRYDMVLNGLVVRSSAPAAREILSRIPGVKYVVRDSIVRAHMNASLPLMKAPEAWALVGGRDTAGAGMRVAIIDSGIGPEHPMFDGTNFEAPAELPGDDYCATVDASFCNGKLILARHYTPTDINETEVDTPYDVDGHGVHVAGTAVGNRVTDAQGTELSGVAPGAYLMVYKALWADGSGSATGSTSGLLQALNDAVSDGADVINNSWGGDASSFDYQLYTDVFGSIEAAGVVLVTSAGNSGPNAATVGCPACAEPGLAIASTNTQSNTLNLSQVTLGDQSFSAVPGADVVHTADLTREAITAASINTNNDDACAPFDAGSFAGGIGLAYRGGETPDAGPCYFYIKAANLKDAGAEGMIIINNRPGDAIIMGGLTDLSFPSVMISQDQGIELLNNLAQGDEITIGAFENSVIPAGSISGFSSRGPNFDPLILKPDLAAPGSPIVSAAIGSSNTSYIALSGTSMSSPHVAGAAAVVLQNKPELTAQQVKSALMNSANPTSAVAGSGSGTANVFASGAGALDLESALGAELLFDTVSLSQACYSVCDYVVNGVYTGTQSLMLSTDLALSNSNASVDLPPTLTVTPGGSFQVPLTIDVSNLVGGWLTGRLIIEDGSASISNASIPLSISVGQTEDDQVLGINGSITPGAASPISVSIAGAPDTPTDATYNVTISSPENILIDESSVSQNLKNVTDATLVGDTTTGTVRWSGSLSELSGSIAPEAFFGTGLSLKNDFEAAIIAQLDCDNVAANPSGCDDVIWGLPVSNHNVEIAGELIETLAISTNGLVIFNDTEEDTSALTYIPQKLPSGDRPNNIIAPFWTDLVLGDNPAGGDVYFGVVEDVSGNWVVVEWWNASEYGTTEPRYTFSLWMKENGSDIFFNYSDLGALPSLLSIGVEDASGASGISQYFSGTGQTPEAGTSHKLAVSAFQGSAIVNFDVLPPNLAEVSNGTLTLSADTSANIDLSSFTAPANVNDVITAQLDANGKRYQATLPVDIPSGDISYNVISQPSHGTLLIVDQQSSDSIFEYTPEAGYVGQDAFVYEVYDVAMPSHISASATITITVDDGSEDSDGDGLSDETELEIGTDPQDPDTDNDGLNDGREVQLGTDPNNADTDGDGFNDGFEVNVGSDPNDANSSPNPSSSPNLAAPLPVWMLYFVGSESEAATTDNRREDTSQLEVGSETGDVRGNSPVQLQ